MTTITSPRRRSCRSRACTAATSCAVCGRARWCSAWPARRAHVQRLRNSSRRPMPIWSPMAAQAWAETKAADADLQGRQGQRAPAGRRQQDRQRRAPCRARSGNSWCSTAKELNAFCLPGGKVGFYKGLIDFVDNDDQIAAVLGHEVGHVVAAPCRPARRPGDADQRRYPGRRRALVGSQVQMSSQSLNMVMAAAGAGAQVGILLPFSRIK